MKNRIVNWLRSIYTTVVPRYYTAPERERPFIGSNRVSTLSGIEDSIMPGRRCGNTTRIVDAAIQQIFAGQEVIVRDHVDDGKNSRMNQMVFEMILRRLEIEHRWCSKQIVYDRNTLLISLKQPLN